MLRGSDYNFQWFHRSNNLSSKTQNLISLVVKDNEFAWLLPSVKTKNNKLHPHFKYFGERTLFNDIEEHYIRVRLDWINKKSIIIEIRVSRPKNTCCGFNQTHKSLKLSQARQPFQSEDNRCLEATPGKHLWKYKFGDTLGWPWTQEEEDLIFVLSYIFVLFRDNDFCFNTWSLLSPTRGALWAKPRFDFSHHL